jgi:tetratricopeptide (TPR) repeat protein
MYQEPEKAIEYANQCIEVDPNNSYCYHIMGMIYFIDGRDFEKSAAFFSKAVELAPENSKHQSWLTAISFLMKPENTLDQARKAFDLAPGTSEAFGTLVFELILQNEMEEAETVCRKRITAAETTPYFQRQGYNELTQVYITSHQYEKTLSLLKEIKKANFSVADPFSSLDIYRFVGEHEKTAQFFQSDLQEMSSMPNANDSTKYFMMPQIVKNYLQANQKEKALQYLDSIPTFQTRFTSHLLHLNFGRLNSLERFRAYAEKVIQGAPEDGIGFRLLGMAYDGQLAYQQAAEAYQQALNKAPNDLQTWRYYAQSCYHAGQTQRSDSLFQQYLHRGGSPNTAGDFFRQQGAYPLAEKYLDLSLDSDGIAIEPKFRTRYEFLQLHGRSALFQDFSPYIFAFIEAAKDSTQHRTAVWNQAWVYYATDQKAELSNFLDKAIKKQRHELEKAHLLYLRGLFAWYDGDQTAGLEWFQKAAEQHFFYRSFLKAMESMAQEDYEAAESHFKEAFRWNLVHGNMRYLYSQVKMELGNPEEALDQLELALELGFGNYEMIRQNPTLEPLRRMEHYKEIMKFHFPKR